MRIAMIPALIAILACGPACSPAHSSAALSPTSAPPEAASGAELFTQGRDAARRGDSVRAEQYLSLAIERGYHPRKVLPLLLDVCLSNSRLRAALNYAEPYLREHPEDDALRYLVANVHVGLGQVDRARMELDLLLRRNPSSAGAHYLLGVVESAVNVEQAREHFRKYLAIAPSGTHAAEVRSRLAEIAIREERARRTTISDGVPDRDGTTLNGPPAAGAASDRVVSPRAHPDPLDATNITERTQ